MKLVLFIASVLFSTFLYANWQKNLSLLLQNNNQEDILRLKKIIVSENPSHKDIISHINNQSYKVSNTTTKFIEKELLCIDGIKRPFITVVPENYNPNNKTPLLIYLHGGVGRTDIIDERIEMVKENKYLPMAIKNGWPMVFPFGQRIATWWDDTGINNILNIIRETKINYNIDDNKIWMTGFSDGASGSFSFSMTNPTPFAGFVPLNGHMGVAAIDGKLHTYASNMNTTPMHVINTDLDGLYPAKKMRKTIDLALKAGADLFYKEYNGFEHDFGYADLELPNIENFFKRSTRNPIPFYVDWKSATSKFGKSFWISINKVSNENAAPWHIDHNLKLYNDRVSFGFYPNYDFLGDGVFVDGIADGDNLSRRMKLQSSDIIIRCNDTPIHNIEDLDEFKNSVNRGDFVNVIVIRNNNEVTLSGFLPEITEYDLFPRDLKSAQVKATFRSNTFFIQASRVKELSIYLHPEMIQLSQKVIINVNGKQIFKKIITPDVSYLIDNYLLNRDKELLYYKKIDISL